MKVSKIYGSGNIFSLGISFFVILHLQYVICNKVNISSEVKGSQRTGELRNGTKSKDKIYHARPEPKKMDKGTAKDEIPQRNVDTNDKTVHTHDGNLVFFQLQAPQRKDESGNKRTSLLLKQTPNNALHVGDGLDLARASILRRKSSPSVVKSCVGNQVTLKCAAEGNPAPEFTWYKGKQQVGREKVAEFDLKIAPSLFTRASHLTFTPNEKDDFGEYECAASNTLGATQQSTHRIRLADRGEPLCTQSTYNKDKKKFHSIIIGTVSAAAMLLFLLCIAGFVFWRLNQQEADSYQRLKSTSANTETLQDRGEGTSESKSQALANDNENTLQDDFNAKEIGRLSSLLAGDWERLARLLGFHQHDINVIREDSDKIESRCADMLNRYRRRRGSRETLAESVEEMKDVEVATAIRQKYYKSNPTE